MGKLKKRGSVLRMRKGVSSNTHHTFPPISSTEGLGVGRNAPSLCSCFCAAMCPRPRDRAVDESEVPVKNRGNS